MSCRPARCIAQSGEIVITSVDREGKGEGFDCELVQGVTEGAGIPVIAHGGAGKAADVVTVIDEAKADAVAIASILHYGLIQHYESGSATDTEGNVEFLQQNRSFNNLQVATVGEVKQTMKEAGIRVRMVETEKEMA